MSQSLGLLEAQEVSLILQFISISRLPYAGDSSHYTEDHN